MTKSEIIKALEPFPDNMDVFIEKTDEQYTYSLTESVKRKDVSFSDEGNPPKANTDVIVISDYNP